MLMPPPTVIPAPMLIPIEEVVMLLLAPLGLLVPALFVAVTVNV
jgi:hypothetical protein